MSKKLKSILAFSAAAVMLFTTTACGKEEEKSKDKEKESSSAVSIDREFDFKGVNSAVSYAENAMNTINDAMEGNLDTSVTTDISLSFGDMMTSELGYDLGEFKISNNAKVKGEMVANDLSLIYDNKTAVTLNVVVDGEDVYVRIPELNDAYIKANVSELSESYSAMDSMGSINAVAMVASPELSTSGISDEMMASLEKFDSEKIDEMLDTYSEIVVDNMPEGEKGDKVSGKIHDLSYEYDTKIYNISGKNAYDMVLDLLNEVKSDSEIAELFESATKAAKEEAESSGYFTDEEIEEMYPSFESMINNAITSWEAEKEDAYEAEETASLVLYYDGEECMGVSIGLEDDGELVIAMIDEAEEFGVTVFVDDPDEEYGQDTNFSFTVEGSNGKYDGKFSVTNDYAEDEYDSYAELGFNSDVTIVDEVSGAFKGDIEFYMSTGDETISLVLTSDSSAKETDLTFELLYNDESMMTIGLTNVTTNATDITVPSGKIYDFSSETDGEEYSASCDMEGFEQHLKDVFGEELYSAMMESSDDDYDDYYDDEYYFNDDYTYYD